MMQLAFPFTCVLARLMPLTLLWPGPSGRLVPLRIRLGLTLTSAIWITSLHADSISSPPGPLRSWARCCGYELLLGLGLALGFFVLLSGLQLAGSLIGQMAGLSLSDFAASGGWGSGSAVDRFFALLTVAALLASNGHRRIVTALLACFQLVPPGSAPPKVDLATLTAEWLTRTFQLGFRVAAPIGFSLLLAMIVMGLLARAIPQLNSIGLGLSLNLILLLAMSFLSIGTMAWVFEQHVVDGLHILTQVLGGSVPPGS
jgi:flagellar biosynthetic protein FliR